MEGHPREHADQGDRQPESPFCQVSNVTIIIDLNLSTPYLFRLKERGIKIAICTSDSREGTIEFLERMGLESMVDVIVCGDDEVLWRDKNE